jgi:hypothetical protein
MPLLLRTSALGFILGLLAVGVFGLRCACLPSEEMREMMKTIHRAEEVTRLNQAAQRRLEGKHQAVQAWMSQRCTWEETMQRMQELDEEMEEAWPGYTRMIGRITPLSAEQRRYQCVFHYVKTVLRERPEELAEVLRRLEKDSQRSPPGNPSSANRQR